MWQAALSGEYTSQTEEATEQPEEDQQSEATAGNASEQEPEQEQEANEEEAPEEQVPEQENTPPAAPPQPPERPPDPPDETETMPSKEDDKSSGLGGKPSDFDGKDWARFSAEVALYLFQNKDKFNGKDDAKIACILSFMKIGSAADWAKQKTRAALINPKDGTILATPNFGTFDTFWQECYDRFGNQNVQRDAHDKIMALQQGGHSVAWYFQELDSLLAQAGYSGTTYDDFLINLVSTRITKEVALEIAKIDPAITTYEAYKKKACTVAQQITAFEQARHDAAPKRPFHPPPRPAFVQKPRPSQPNPVKRDKAGVTFGGMGEPMQVDRTKARYACFRCGDPSHFSRNCPEHKKDAKNFIRATLPEQRMALYEELSRTIAEEEDEYEDDPDQPSFPYYSNEQSFSETEQ